MSIAEDYDFGYDPDEPVVLGYSRKLQETPKAYLLQIGITPVWLPKSLAELDTKRMQVTITERLLHKLDVDLRAVID